MSTPKARVWNFVDPPPSDYYCPMCGAVLQEPMLTSCCGSHFCKACIEPILQENKPCPEKDCNETEYLSIVDKPKWRKIMELDVICPLKGRGCNWIGEMSTLERHLDPLEGDCDYIDVKCTSGCGEEMERYELAEHLRQFCQKRPYTCEYCGIEDMYEIVVKDHFPECPAYPVPCPNNCGDDDITRSVYPEHLLKCPRQEVDCEFSYAGCTKRVQRKDMSQHQHDGVLTHLSLQTAFASKQIDERDQKLTELCNSWEERFQQMKLSMEKLLAEHSQREDTLKKSIDNLERVIQKMGLSLAFSNGRRLSLKQGNIASEHVDVIVNATSLDLDFFHGVSKALNEASNRSLAKQFGRMKIGEIDKGSIICSQGGGALQCKSVIHAIGPNPYNETILSTLVTNILKKAEQMNACSIAIPAISAGSCRSHRGDIAKTIIGVILSNAFTNGPPILSDIRIVILDKNTYETFADCFMQKLLSSVDS